MPRVRALALAMAARAIWKGRLLLGELEVPVKMYSAVQDRKVHFRLLDKESLAPVHQRIVRKADGKEVPRKDRWKAFPLDDQRSVVLTREELKALAPRPSRKIHLCRFVAPPLLGDEWYDRPYYLGPDKDKAAYFQLAAALARERLFGIARWVMRRKRYAGALYAHDGYLMMVTLRRADQVLELPEVDLESRAGAKELQLAKRLIETVSGDFDPGLWEDEYHERVCRLIAAKASGGKVEAARPKRRRESGNLAERLRRSLASAKEQSHA